MSEIIKGIGLQIANLTTEYIINPTPQMKETVMKGLEFYNLSSIHLGVKSELKDVDLRPILKGVLDEIIKLIAESPSKVLFQKVERIMELLK